MIFNKNNLLTCLPFTFIRSNLKQFKKLMSTRRNTFNKNKDILKKIDLILNKKSNNVCEKKTNADKLFICLKKNILLKKQSNELYFQKQIIYGLKKDQKELLSNLDKLNKNNEEILQQMSSLQKKQDHILDNQVSYTNLFINKIGFTCNLLTLIGIPLLNSNYVPLDFSNTLLMTDISLFILY